MRTADFDYPISPHQIAQYPAPCRDQARLLIFPRHSPAALEHRIFRDLAAYLRPGDLLVLNDSRVLPARLRCLKEQTGARIEALLLEENGDNDWWALLGPGKKAPIGSRLTILDANLRPTRFTAEIIAKNPQGHGRLIISGPGVFRAALEECGEVPLPPYIKGPRTAGKDYDRERYQTVYARADGSVAAPTAGLHLTREFLETLPSMGVEVATVTLHVGLGTFAPVKADLAADHVMHPERFSVPPSSARLISAAKAGGRRVIAVGTTSLRVLESVAGPHGVVRAGSGSTSLFIYPPRRFKIVDGLITNFHLPRSTLLMLVSAFASPGTISGKNRLLSAYREAMELGYRFFSYGDAMFLY